MEIIRQKSIEFCCEKMFDLFENEQLDLPNWKGDNQGQIYFTDFDITIDYCPFCGDKINTEAG